MVYQDIIPRALNPRRPGSAPRPPSPIFRNRSSREHDKTFLGDGKGFSDFAGHWYVRFTIEDDPWPNKYTIANVVDLTYDLKYEVWEDYLEIPARSEATLILKLFSTKMSGGDIYNDLVQATLKEFVEWYHQDERCLEPPLGIWFHVPASDGNRSPVIQDGDQIRIHDSQAALASETAHQMSGALVDDGHGHQEHEDDGDYEGRVLRLVGEPSLVHGRRRQGHQHPEDYEVEDWHETYSLLRDS